MPRRSDSASSACCIGSCAPKSMKVVVPLRQQLGDRIGRRIDAAPGGRLVLVRPLDPVAGIAAVGAAAAGRQGLEEGLAEILGPPGIGDQPMGGAVAGMDVGVDEAGRNQLGSRVDFAVEVAVVVRADMDDRLVLVDHHPVTDQRMCGTGIPNHPTAANERPHESLPWPSRPRTRQRRDRLAQLLPLSLAHIEPSTPRSNHDMDRDGNHPTVWPPPLHPDIPGSIERPCQSTLGVHEKVE